MKTPLSYTDTNISFFERHNQYVISYDNFELVFNKTPTNTFLFKMSVDDWCLTVFPPRQSVLENIASAQLIKIKNLSNGITRLDEYIVYENILNGIDVGFSFSDRKIEQCFVIKSKDCVANIDYMIKFEKLHCIQSDNCEILEFYSKNTNKKLFSVSTDKCYKSVVNRQAENQLILSSYIASEKSASSNDSKSPIKIQQLYEFFE